VTRQEIEKKIDKLMRDYFENQDSEIPDQILELGDQLSDDLRARTPPTA
jgi:hypothetical protein